MKMTETKFELLEKDQIRMKEINKAFEKFWHACDNYSKSINLSGEEVAKAREKWIKTSNELTKALDKKEKEDNSKMIRKLKKELKHEIKSYVEPKNIYVAFDYAAISNSQDGYYAIVRLKNIDYNNLDQLNKKWHNPSLRVVDGYIKLYLYHTKYW
jgi:hypothetical protein